MASSPRVRRVSRVIREIDPITTLKVGAVFHLVAYLTALVALVLLWSVASATGTIDNIESAKEVLQQEKDEEFRAMAKDELESNSQRLEVLEVEIRVLLLPQDPEDSKNAIVEIRGGTGGDEASIFAGDLYRMYTRYCENRGWKVVVADMNEGNTGGYKEIVFEVTGENVYGTLKFESGVHRVQRIPETEAKGRVHTSAVTVAVLPEAEDVDVNINPADLRIDVFRSGGAGGQGVNTTDSAVRITHLPTGTVVVCQDERSQHKNKDKAMKILRSRLLDAEQERAAKEHSDARRTMVGTGDRSERIRTYNFPQGRLTDHRINLTLYKLADVVEGDLDDVIGPLANEYRADQLGALGLAG